MNTTITSLGVFGFALAIVAATVFLFSKQRKVERRRSCRSDGSPASAGDRQEESFPEPASPLQRSSGGAQPRLFTVDEQMRYVDAWRLVQARFVDDPIRAVADADRLMEEMIAARGYPVGGIGYRLADISEGDRDAVEHYRMGHEIVQQQLRGRATTDDLRQAMIHYRILFDTLIGRAQALWPADAI
jgi:hypothetical protein